ncbi:hypothetical protein JXR93_02030 [bacterium]|nr:hypothetical protein [bacterium]
MDNNKQVDFDKLTELLENHINSKKVYSIEDKLDKIGKIFKTILWIVILLMISFVIFVIFFDFEKINEKSKTDFKRGVFNISFSNEADFKKSEKYLNSFDEVIFDSSGFNPNDSKFIPIYETAFGFYSNTSATTKEDFLKYNIKDFNNSKINKDLNSNKIESPFIIAKHSLDSTSYQRNSLGYYRFVELFNGKIAFESFFYFPYISFIHLIAGLVASSELYNYEYSLRLTKIVESQLKIAFGYFIPSYNNTDSSAHSLLLDFYTIYYKGSSIIESLKTGNYFSANEKIASGTLFNYSIKQNILEYKISTLKKIWKIDIYKNGSLYSSSKKNSDNIVLEKGFYRVVIYKLESYLFREIPLYWVYFNFEIE